MELNKNLGWIIITSVGYTAIIIMILHVLQPDKDPAVHAISEYVDGHYGVLMTSVFFAQSIGSITLAMVVIRIRPRGKKILIGGILFLMAAFGDAIAGLFPADPVSTEPMTSAGIVHMVGGLMRFVSLAIGLPLLSSVLKKNEHWQKQGSLLNLLGILFVPVLLGTLFVLAPLGLFGIGQRIFIGTALAWMFIVGLPMIQMKKLQ